jgi:hypothetical protein
MITFVKILCFLCFCLSLPFICLGQTFVDFKMSDPGVKDCCRPFDAFLNPIDKETANRVLNEVIELKVPSKHINGFCEARAQFIATKISSLCSVGKIWAFAPSLYSMLSTQKLTATDLLLNDRSISWGYHVAPIIAVINGDKIDTLVVDFSIQDSKFTEYHQWLSKLNCPNLIYTIINYNYYLFWTLNGLQLNGSKVTNLSLPEKFPKVMTGDFFYPLLNDSVSVPSGLAYNDVAIHLIQTYYTNPLYVGEKAEIADHLNINKLKDLANNGTSTLPDEIKKECSSFFKVRLEYWQEAYLSQASESNVMKAIAPQQKSQLKALPKPLSESERQWVQEEIEMRQNHALRENYRKQIDYLDSEVNK